MKLNSNNFKIHKLTMNDSLDKFDFDCGDKDLNIFLFKDSFKYIKNNLAVVYLIFYHQELLGYFSLTSDAIRVNKKLEVIHGFYPAVKIGRFAVNKKYNSKGIGSYMMELIVAMINIIKEDVGIRYLSVDAYNDDKVISFYQKHNFEILKKVRNREQIPMYLDINFKEVYQ